MSSHIALALLALIGHANGAENSSDPNAFDIDPYLEFRPEFARSLPIQILLTGIVLTLVVVLLIHLIFTAQYHWPLAPVNYVLQVSGAMTLFISLIAMLHVVLSATITESQTWPYMLSYIAISIPPFSAESNVWSTPERATWLVMNAATSGLIQITLIQFLTFLYPSRLEGRLILSLFCPLAIVAAIMQLIPMQGNSDVTLIACAVSNVCNATLSLLCTASLFFWGVVVNRRQAWRTDGGTAAFGAGTLFLSVLGTGLNFLYIPREEEYLWLPGLIWAVVLWQSFLGWWWWVGAGSGGGVMDEKDGKGRVEEMMSREEKRQRRRQERTDKRQERKDKAKSMWKGVAGAFGSKDDGENSSTRSVSTMQQLSPSTSTASDGQSDIPYTPPNIFHRWCSVVRHAHQTAAREQAEERIERIREMERGNLVRTRAGWGIGSFESSVGGRRELSQTRSPNRGEKEMEMEMEKVTDGSYGEGGVERAGRTQRQDMQSITWWGPLRRWRLQDSTVYSRSAAG